MAALDISVRRRRDGDKAAVLAVLREAFEQNDEARLVEKLWAADAMHGEFVAEQNGDVIGYCAFSEVTAKPALDGLLLGLAPVAVAPARQNCGVGAALVEQGLKACRAKGAVLVVVLGEPCYYRRFGFEPASGKNLAWAAMDAGGAFQFIDLGGALGDEPRQISYHPAFDGV